MIVYLKNKKIIQPEIEEIFGVVNDEARIINVKCIETEEPDSCEGCAFYPICENGKGEVTTNRTQFACYNGDRLDNKDVIFKIVG